MTTDNLMREVRRLDPVGSGELKGALDTQEAADLLERILALEFDPAAHPLYRDERRGGPFGYLRRGRGRRRTTKLTLAAVAVTAAAVLAFLIGSSMSGGGGSTAGPLGNAAAAAASQSQVASALPFTYSKTREVAVTESGVGKRSWSVYEPTTREEWVGPNGSGRLRVITGPSRFVGSGDRAEWVAAGSPNVLALGFGRRTEDRWLAGGLLPRNVEELPAEPRAIATRLRYEAEVEQGTLPVPAATLQLIAEDLRDPAASPALRRALYQAAGLVPGIHDLGEAVDPENRSGVAIGVTSTYAGEPARYLLIFDPETSAVLATETTSLAPPQPGGVDEPTLVRARAFLESRGVESKGEFAKTWLMGLEPPDSSAQSLASFLVYRVPAGAAR